MTAYIAPQTFREWHPIAISKSINIKKPFIFNIGHLPMILWFANNKSNVMINSCKHLGNNLKDSKINNGCLVCPFHKQSYNQTDNLGSIANSNGLLWWSYKSNYKNPFSIIKTEDKPYNFQIDINNDLISFILNFISLFDNNNTNNANNTNHYYHNKNKKIVMITNNDFKILFKYPYSIIIKMNKFKGVFMISILPLSFDKLRLFVTTYNPYSNLLSFLYMNYIKKIFENNNENPNRNYVKNFLLLSKGINDKNKYLEIINEMFKNYDILNDYTIINFMRNKNFY